MSSAVSAKETLESSLKSAHEKSNDYQIQIESIQKDFAVSQDELSKFTEKSEKLQNLTVELQDQLKAKEDEHDKALDKLEVITARLYLGGVFFYLCFDFDIAARALLWGTENFKAIF